MKKFQRTMSIIGILTVFSLVCYQSISASDETAEAIKLAEELLKRKFGVGLSQKAQIDILCIRFNIPRGPSISVEMGNASHVDNLSPSFSTLACPPPGNITTTTDKYEVFRTDTWEVAAALKLSKKTIQLLKASGEYTFVVRGLIKSHSIPIHVHKPDGSQLECGARYMDRVDEIRIFYAGYQSNSYEGSIPLSFDDNVNDFVVQVMAANKHNTAYSLPVVYLDSWREHPLPRSCLLKIGSYCGSGMKSVPVDPYGVFPVHRTILVEEMECGLVPNTVCLGLNFETQEYQTQPYGSIDVTFNGLPDSGGIIITDMDWTNFHNPAIDFAVITMLFDSMKTETASIRISPLGKVSGSAVLKYYTNIGPITGMTSFNGYYDYLTGDLNAETFSSFKCEGVNDWIGVVNDLTFYWTSGGVVMTDEWYYRYRLIGTEDQIFETHSGILDFRAKHPEYDNYGVEFMFFPPDGADGWRQTVTHPNGVSDVYAYNTSEFPGVIWNIPDIVPSSEHAYDTIFTAVDMALYIEQNPGGFNDGNWGDNVNLKDLDIQIVAGQIEGCEGIYWAVSEFLEAGLKGSTPVPVGGPDDLLDSEDYSEGLLIVARHTNQDFAEISSGGCCLIPGDANHDGLTNVGDAVFGISYIFKGGPAPVCLDEGDANRDCDYNIGDVVLLINYVYKGGVSPLCGCVE